MKNSKKLIALLLVLVMTLTLAACKKEAVNPYADLAGDYDALSEAVYNDVLGGENFADVYAKAKTEAKSVSERHALMAVTTLSAVPFPTPPLPSCGVTTTSVTTAFWLPPSP